MEQKKIWRLIERAERTWIICATCLSWPPIEVLGNCVAKGVPVASAAARLLLSAKAKPVMLLAACTRDTPLSNVSKFCIALLRFVSKLLNAELCPGETAAGRVARPVANMLAPATETIVGSLALGLKHCVMSAERPAQPLLPLLLGAEVCH